MDEGIAGKPDRPILIIEAPSPPPPNSQKWKNKITFWPICNKTGCYCFPLFICLHCDEVCIC